jgi:hypothetical protein
MNDDLARQWAEALESGQYQQGRERLRGRTAEGDVYCCLGVLGDLVSPERWEPDVWGDEEDDVYACYSLDGDYEHLSPRLRELTGLDAVTMRAFSSMNDDDEMSFQDIAAHIRSKMGTR